MEKVNKKNGEEEDKKKNVKKGAKTWGKNANQGR
jgi:hypothetical protein